MPIIFPKHYPAPTEEEKRLEAYIDKNYDSFKMIPYLIILVIGIAAIFGGC